MEIVRQALGNRCEICGSSDDLEIDHVDGRDWEPRKKSAHCRAKRYLYELMAGVHLRLLCATCNGRDGQRRSWEITSKRTRTGVVDRQEHNMPGSSRSMEA
jgi:hypothetical protein